MNDRDRDDLSAGWLEFLDDLEIVVVLAAAALAFWLLLVLI